MPPTHVYRGLQLFARTVTKSTQCRYLATSSPGNKLVRVSKRMSELDMCSRREADSLIESGQVIVNGKRAQIGQKVKSNEKDIVILDAISDGDLSAIVLNKPMGYVSGQPEDGHIPAIKLLTAENCLPGSMKIDNFFSNRGFVAAGRLDLNSTGLLIFTKSGVLAKKLVSTSGKIEKEYIITVEKAQQLMRVELEKGLTMLPSPTHDLNIITRGGQRLFGDTRPLKPVNAKWLERGEILKK